MSAKMFKKVFGAKKDNTPREPHDASIPKAILKLKETEEMLIKKQNYVESKIQRELAMAKTNAKKNKKLALAALQRKKKLERELQRLDGALTTLETQRDILETANTNSVVLSSLSDASGAIKAAHKHMNADKIDELMDDLVGQKELSDEISNAIGNPVGFNDDIDEDELEAELAELELDDLEEFSTLPTVPTDELRTPKRQVPQKILTIAS